MSSFRKYLMKYYCLPYILFLGFNLFCEPLKILHLSFHKGCINDFQEVASHLHLDLTNWFICPNGGTLNHEEFEGISYGSSVHNISKARAINIWLKHKDFFNTFDVVITSDTAPLSRIFLENRWHKPLIIWVCNRFDFFDPTEPRFGFPDQDYYNLINWASKEKNVHFVSYTPFEYLYGYCKDVDLGRRVIKPIGVLQYDRKFVSSIPSTVKKQSTFFIYPRMNEKQINLVKHNCGSIGFNTYTGVYNGPKDLEDFKGIIYFPYQPSNLALFENIQLGIVHFVPSSKFIINNQEVYRYWTLKHFELCEWYSKSNQNLFVYFDSWDDLKTKIESLDFKSKKEYIKKFALNHKATMLSRWKQIFSSFKKSQ